MAYGKPKAKDGSNWVDVLPNITDQSEESSPADDDELLLYDVSAEEYKKVQAQNLGGSAPASITESSTNLDNGSTHTHALAAAAVDQSRLKTSQTYITVSSYGGAYALPGGEYGFWVQIKGNSNGQSVLVVVDSFASYRASYITPIRVTHVGGTTTTYVQQRYITASGEIYWIFILRDRVSKEIKGVVSAPDHPCFGNGGDPELVPHPFLDFDEGTDEIVVINPTPDQVKCTKDKLRRPDGMRDNTKGFWEALQEVFDIEETAAPSWPDTPVTIGLPMDVDPTPGTLCTPVKKIIPDLRNQYKSGSVKLLSLTDKSK